MLSGHGDADSVAAAPQQLIKAMVNRAPALRNVEIVHLRTVLHITAAADDRPSFLLTHWLGAQTRRVQLNTQSPSTTADTATVTGDCLTRWRRRQIFAVVLLEQCLCGSERPLCRARGSCRLHSGVSERSAAVVQRRCAADRRGAPSSVAARCARLLFARRVGRCVDHGSRMCSHRAGPNQSAHATHTWYSPAGNAEALN
jgi:hypothetical protein